MTYNLKNSLVSHAALMVLMFGLASFSAFAGQGPADDIPEQASRPMEPLTNFEKMELHYRRYSTAANNMAQLFKQLNQKTQEVSLAAKAAEAKDNSQNRRHLETKLRQLENASATYGIQYSQLHAQMQNEYRNYMALSNDLKARYDTAKESKNRENETKDAAGSKAKPAKNKELTSKERKEGKEGKETKEAKEAKETKETKTRVGAKNIKAKETRTEDLHAGAASSTKDPRVMDLDATEVRARRDATGPGSVAGPALNIVR